MCACCGVRQGDDERSDRGWFFGWGGGGSASNGAGAGGDSSANHSVEPLPLTRNSARASGSAGGAASSTHHDEEASAAVVRRHVDATVGRTALLLYSISDVQCGRAPEISGAGAAAGGGQRRVQKALHVPPNTTEGIPMETDCFAGKMVVMYRDPDPRESGTGSGSPYAEYFNRRKRNWEVRVQGRFKRVPKGDMFIGIVLRDFNYDQAIAGHSKIVKRAGMALVRSYDLYLSWGDRQKEANKPDAELSHLVTGMSGWDQIIITPSGREPPPISTELQDIGDSHGLNFERSKMGLANYSEAMDETFRNVSTEDTYTMCFWGVSQVIDLLAWQFKIGTNISMARFFEESPLHVAMYELERPSNGNSGRNADQHHLESRKRYYLDLMFWSNAVDCPSLPSRYIFQDAPNGLGAGRSRPGSLGAAAAQGVQQRESHGRSVSPTSSTGSWSGPRTNRSLLATWSERLRWIPDLTCSPQENGGGRECRRTSR